MLLTGCQQHSVTGACHCVRTEGKPTEKLPHSVLVNKLASRLQSDEGHPHCVQEAGYTGSHSEVPGLMQATLSQLPTTAGLLTAASSAIQLRLLHLCSFQRWLIARFRQLLAVHNWNTLFQVTTSCSVHLRPWRQEEFL